MAYFVTAYFVMTVNDTRWPSVDGPGAEKGCPDGAEAGRHAM
jgi:hypothetical protein